MLVPFSQTEVAFRDTLITKAEGVALDVLGRMYGFPRLGIFERKYYRRALREVAFGRRGTYRMFFKVLESLFDQYSERRGIVNVTLDPAQPSLLIYREGGAPAFDCASVQRFVRVTSPTFGSKIYYSLGHTDSGDLILNDVDNPSVTGADWSSLSAPENATAKILGFMIHERNPGPPKVDGDDLNDNPWHPIDYMPEKTCTIDLFVDSFIWSTPATYLQEDGTVDRTIVAPNQPFGGHLMSLYDAANRLVVEYPQSGVASEIHPESGDQDIGPFPIYLNAEGKLAGAFIEVLDSLLAAGVHLTAEIKDWCDDLNNVVFNPFSPDFDLGNGGQGLPDNWDFEQNGIPRNVANREIEAAEHVNEYFIFEDAQSNKFYIEEKAKVMLSNTGDVVLDDDSLYRLVTIINGLEAPLNISNADDLLDVNAFGTLKNIERVQLCQIPVATFVDANGFDASSELADVAGTELKTETAESGAPVIQLPGANRNDLDPDTPDTITRLLPRTLDLQGTGVAGYFQAKDVNGNFYWTQDVVLINDNGVLRTDQGLYFDPPINISNGVNALVIKEDGSVFEDAGQGEQQAGAFTFGVFPNPNGLVKADFGDVIFKETTAILQPIEHRRSGSPTVGTLAATATRGRLKINGILGGGIVLLDGTSRVQVVPK